MAVEIKKLQSMYRVTVAPGQSVVMAAQDLRDIYEYALLHMSELEREAKTVESSQVKEVKESE
jgi:hypothetical protein